MKNKKIKVAIVIGNLNVGGAEKLVVDQLNCFNKEKFEFCLVTLFTSDKKESFLDRVPSDIQIFKLNFRSFADASSFFKLVRVMSSIKPDVVVSHLFFSNTITRLIKPLLGYKAIAVEQNTYTNKAKLKIFTDKILSYLTYKIVAVSDTVADFTSKQERIPISKFVVIPNGIDFNNFTKKLSTLPAKETLKQELGFEQKDKIILNVARLVAQKNHKLLIDGFALFNKKFPEYKLAIVGGGDLSSELKDYAKSKGVADSVVFFGSRTDVEKFYKASEFFVLTSKIEGFSIVCIEAMASGLPVLSTKTAGPDKYVVDGKNGYLLSDHSESCVEVGMSKIASGDKEFFANNAIDTAKKYDIPTLTKQYEVLFEEAVYGARQKKSVSLITFANLGRKTNLKTIDVVPVIKTFVAKGKLSQVICQINSGYFFANTQSAIPAPIRFLIGGLRRAGLSLSRSSVEWLFDFFAVMKLQKVEVTMLHGGYFLPRVTRRARKMGSIIVDITVSAHLKTNAALEKEELALLKLDSFDGRYLQLARKDKHTNTFDYVIAFSQFVKDSYVDSGFPSEKIFVAEPDIDIERFKPKKEISDGIFRVIYVAHTQPLKGLHYLLEAWEKLSITNVELVLVGGFSDMPDTLKKQYEGQIRKNHSIKWISSTNNPENWYHKSDLLVMPSLTEGLSRVILEAMACGIPVITTENAKAIVEDGKTGFVVPVRNPHAIKEKIEFLYHNKHTAEKMGADARLAVENKKPFGEAVFEIYQEILRREKRQ